MFSMCAPTTSVKLCAVFWSRQRNRGITVGRSAAAAGAQSACTLTIRTRPQDLEPHVAAERLMRSCHICTTRSFKGSSRHLSKQIHDKRDTDTQHRFAARYDMTSPVSYDFMSDKVLKPIKIRQQGTSTVAEQDTSQV